MHALAETALQVLVALLYVSAAVALLALLCLALMLLIDWDHERMKRRIDNERFNRNCKLFNELRAKEKLARDIAVKDQTRRGPEVIARGWER